MTIDEALAHPWLNVSFSFSRFFCKILLVPLSKMLRMYINLSHVLNHYLFGGVGG